MEIRKCIFLNQSLHPFHTQTNEARNQAQAGLTPKAKSFHESMSFHYRHAIQVGTHNLGFRQFWTQVFDDIGVPYSQSFVDHLDRVVSRRKRWKEYHGKIEVKRRRAHKQDATEKNFFTKIGRQNTRLASDWISAARQRQGRNQTPTRSELIADVDQPRIKQPALVSAS